MKRLRLPKRVLGYLVVLAVGVTLTSAIVPVANAVTCADPPCNTCKNGTWDAHAYTCCGSNWDCSNCTVCAN